MPVWQMPFTLCVAGILQLCLVTNGFVDSVQNLINNGKTFRRVDEEMSWDKALEFCRRYETDLADLQSMTSLKSLQAIYSCLQSQDAWIGLHFDTSTQKLAWSSGTAFTELGWSKTPALPAGYCATVYINMIYFPSLSAASCATQKPFICYYDKNMGHRISTEPAVSLTTSPKPAMIKIGRQTFVRFDQTRTWLHALWYCRNYYTDLADLQTVTDEESNKALRSITTNTEAWIGLYFNANSGALNWSSDLGDSVPSWLKVPKMGVGLCAGLGIFSKSPPQVYATDCSSLRPFICFLDTSIGQRSLASLPPLLPSWEGTTEMTLRLRSSTRSKDPALTTQIQQRVTLAPIKPTEPTEPAHHKSLGDTSTHKEETRTTQISTQGTFSSVLLSGNFAVVWEAREMALTSRWSLPAASVTPGDPTTTQETVSNPSLSSACSAPHSRSCSLETPGTKDRASEPTDPGSPAVTQGQIMNPKWAIQVQAIGLDPVEIQRGPQTAVTHEKSDPDIRHITTAAQARYLNPSKHSESQEETSAPKSGKLFGILKADFTIPALMNPEEMKDQFLSEIEEVLKLTLGAEQFILKGVGLEVKKK